jgi:hypothetical protein
MVFARSKLGPSILLLLFQNIVLVQLLNQFLEELDRVL